MPICKGVTVLDFDGSGDIHLGASDNLVLMITGEPKEIGAPVNCRATSPEVVMRFANSESIDVLINALNKVKQNLGE